MYPGTYRIYTVHTIYINSTLTKSAVNSCYSAVLNQDLKVQVSSLKTFFFFFKFLFLIMVTPLLQKKIFMDIKKQNNNNNKLPNLFAKEARIQINRLQLVKLQSFC